MRAYHHHAARLLSAVTLIGLLTVFDAAAPYAQAQQNDDPFGAPLDDPGLGDAAMDEPTDAPAFGDSIDVFGADAAAAGVAPPSMPGGKTPEAVEPVGPTDPAVLAILDWKPQTPVQIFARSTSWPNSNMPRRPSRLSIS